MADKARTVLVGFTGTESARRAVLRAADLAGGDGHVIVVAVIEPSQAIGARIEEDIEREKLERHNELLAEVRAILRSTGVTVDIEERIGAPPEEILKASEKHAVDVIALGRGRSRRLQRLRQPVWGRVASEAEMPVVVVP